MKAHAVADACRLVLVDGVFAPQLSDLTALEKGLRVQSLREALDAGSDQSADLLKTTTDVMVSLNAAMATDGVVVAVDDGVALNRPVHIIHVTTASSASVFTRSRVHIGKDAQRYPR